MNTKTNGNNPFGNFFNRVRDKEEWSATLRNIWDHIVLFSKTAGRSATREVLKAFFIIKDGSIPLEERIILLAGITYVVIPNDLLPAKKFGILGILDDATVMAYINRKLHQCMTPDINDKVESTLNQWFGPEYVFTKILDNQ